MKTKAKIGVMLAYEDGKTIQIYSCNEWSDWDNYNKKRPPNWNWEQNNYRIKPKEKKKVKLYLWLYKFNCDNRWTDAPYRAKDLNEFKDLIFKDYNEFPDDFKRLDYTMIEIEETK